jgi:hypothetical protein
MPIRTSRWLTVTQDMVDQHAVNSGDGYAEWVPGYVRAILPASMRTATSACTAGWEKCSNRAARTSPRSMWSRCWRAWIWSPRPWAWVWRIR